MNSNFKNSETKIIFNPKIKHIGHCYKYMLLGVF